MKTHLLRIKEVSAITGLSRSTIYSAIKNKIFPNSVKIGERSVAWRSNDIEKWIEERPTSTQLSGEE